ncbi:zinc finger protein 26 [Elysia marginata]|uniref:Zinc finger protein 26 n=1 Tax=Elysia marginata TaxID=1093978 RepID=A0AAV4EBP5_9GAST|nr:zinc finger protein 26 [Elysia marginata]
MATTVSNCQRQFLFEKETAGLLFLTLDDHDPVYIGFQHRVKLELSASKDGGLSYTRDMPSVTPATANIEDRYKPGKETPRDKPFDTGLASPSVSRAPEPSQNKPLDKPGSCSSSFPNLYRSDIERDASQRKVDPKTLQRNIPSERSQLTLDKSNNNKGFSKKRLTVTRKLQNKKKISRQSHIGETSKQTSDQRAMSSPRLPDQSTSQETALPHLPLKENVKSVTCEYCNTTFSSKKEFYEHRLFKSEKSHRCYICLDSFPFRGYLLVHLKLHEQGPKINTTICNECGHTAKNLSELKKHMVNHTGEHMYKCCKCSKTFAHLSGWRSHMGVHRSAGRIRCSCCSQSFPSRAALSEHKMALLEIKCGLCGQVFPNRASRAIHFKSEHGDTILRCHICTRMYSTQRELEEHTAKHTKNRRKQCPVCGQMVTNLNNHILTHKPLEEMSEADVWMCDKCPRKFRTKSTLLNHIKTNHSETRSKCHLCSQSFKNYKGLYRHLNNVHSDLMPYQCEVCGKRCKLKSNLKIHMRVHSSVKMFPCQLCDQAFNYKSSLEGHLRSKHSTDKQSYTVSTGVSQPAKTASTPGWEVSVEQVGPSSSQSQWPAEQVGPPTSSVATGTTVSHSVTDLT